MVATCVGIACLCLTAACCSPFEFFRLLIRSGLVESTNKLGDIIIVFLLLLASSGSTRALEGILELLVLGGAQLLEDIGKHRLERLGLGGASDTEEVLSNRERS